MVGTSVRAGNRGASSAIDHRHIRKSPAKRCITDHTLTRFANTNTKRRARSILKAKGSTERGEMAERCLQLLAAAVAATRTGTVSLAFLLTPEEFDPGKMHGIAILNPNRIELLDDTGRLQNALETF